MIHVNDIYMKIQKNRKIIEKNMYYIIGGRERSDPVIIYLIYKKYKYTKNSCNIKSKMLYYKWVMKDAKIQTNQNKIE